MSAVEFAFSEDLSTVGRGLEPQASPIYAADFDTSRFGKGNSGSYSEAKNAELILSYDDALSDAISDYTGVEDTVNVYFDELEEGVDGATDLVTGDITLNENVKRGETYTGVSPASVHKHERGHDVQRKKGLQYGFNSVALSGGLTPLLEGQVAAELDGGQPVYQDEQKLYQELMSYSSKELEGVELPVFEYSAFPVGPFTFAMPVQVDSIDLGQEVRPYLDETKEVLNYIDTIEPPAEIDQIAGQPAASYATPATAF